MTILRKLLGAGAVAGGGFLGTLAMNPAMFNRTPDQPNTPLYTSAVEAIAKANNVPFNGTPAVSRVGSLEQLELAAKKPSDEGVFDMVVIGGGSTGAAVALDAASRGMQVAMIEKGDFACETSSKSTKLVHGGVRYLEKAIFGINVKQLALVFEALGERATLLRQAPHLCYELPTVIPCYTQFDRVFYWAGMKAYDMLAALGGSTLMGGSRVADVDETLHLAPLIRQSHGKNDYQFNVESEVHNYKFGQPLVGSVVYYDGSMDDARLNVSAALTAGAIGATIVNHCEAVAITPTSGRADDGSRNPPRSTVTVRDSVTGRTVDVRTRFVVSATGPFGDRTKKLVRNPDGTPKEEPPEGERREVLVSRGTHLSFGSFLTAPSTPAAEHAAVLIPRTRDGRVLFIAPWHGATIAGTTDTPVDSPDTPTATEDDVEFILTSVNDAFCTNLSRDDITSQWAGLRPLAAPDEDQEAKNVVREHRILMSPEGVAMVVGGKWTTYRRIGQDVVDAILYSRADPEFTERFGTLKSNRSTSALLPFVGAPQWFDRRAAATVSFKWGQQTTAHRRELGGEETGDRLWHTYGVRAPVVLEAAADLERKTFFNSLSPVLAPGSAKNAKPSAVQVDAVRRASPAGVFDRLVPHHDVLSAEVVYSCRHEMCSTVDDFLCRRTRLAFTDAAAALSAVDKVAAIMACELKWSPERTAIEAQKARAKIETFVPTRKTSALEQANKRKGMFSSLLSSVAISL